MKKINWLNTLFLTLTPLTGLVGAGILMHQHVIVSKTVIMMFILIAVSGLSITAGYHRLFSHGSYKALWPVRLFFALFGAGCFQGSILEWSTDHRDHHRYSDTDRDPYSIREGFWHAHILWLFKLDPSRRNFDNVKELQEDPIIMWQHRYYEIISVLMGFGFPTLLGALWGDALGGFILGGCVRATVSHHVTFAINSICHWLGRKTYSDTESARDNWFTALLTYGEGYHNFHHQFPIDYRNGIRFYDYDPTKWLIRTLAFFNLVSDLKTVSMARIVKYRVRMDERRMMACLKNLSNQVSEPLLETTASLKKRLMDGIERLVELEKEYKKLRDVHFPEMRDKVIEEWHRRILEHRVRLKAARRELKQFFLVWKRLVNDKTLQLWLEGRSPKATG